MSWLSGWQYRKKITISGSSGAGTNYQVLLKVGESSGASGCDFHVEGHSANFPSDTNNSGDLRFTDNDGTTLLSFWVEKVEGTSPNRVAHIWVEVKDDLGSNVDIYCYYGNSNATNVSDGDSTFLFFDDFPGSSLDGTKWDQSTGGNVTVSNSEVHMELSPPGSDWASCWIRGKSGCGNNILVKYLAKQEVHPHTTSDVTAWNGLYAREGVNIEWLVRFIGNGTKTNDRENVVDEYENHGDPPNRHVENNTDYNNQWLEVELWVAPTNKKAWVDGVLWWEEAHSDSYFNDIVPKVGMGIHATATAASKVDIDYVFVRARVDPEPSFSSAGSEITQPTFSDLVTSWKLITRSEVSSKWRILTSAELVSSWKLFNWLDKGISWRVGEVQLFFWISDTLLDVVVDSTTELVSLPLYVQFCTGYQVEAIVVSSCTDKRNCFLCAPFLSTSTHNAFVQRKSTEELSVLETTVEVRKVSERGVYVESAEVSQRICNICYPVYSEKGVYLYVYKVTDMEALCCKRPLAESDSRSCFTLATDWNCCNKKEIWLQTVSGTFSERLAEVQSFPGWISERGAILANFGVVDVEVVPITFGYFEGSWRQCFTEGVTFNSIRNCLVESARWVWISITPMYPQPYSLLEGVEKVDFTFSILSAIQLDTDSILVTLNGEKIEVKEVKSIQGDKEVAVKTVEAEIQKGINTVTVQVFDILGNTYEENFQYWR